MVDRIQLLVPTYMPIDGQWNIVYPGSVVDVPTATETAQPTTFPASVATKLSPTEAAGTLASHGKPTPVRNVRTR